MMKRAAACLLTLLFLFAAGCSGNNGTVSMDVDKVADQIINTVKFKDQMSPIGLNAVTKLYGLSGSDVEKAKVYESTGATAEEVAVFETKNTDAVQKAIQKRMEAQKSGFEGYQPKEMAKLKNPLIVQAGNYVVLVVADDTTSAKKIIDGLMKH